MQNKILILILILYGVAICDAKKKKPAKLPKVVKQLNTLCLALDADMVTVRDPVFNGFFSGIDGFCGDLMAAMNGTGKVPSKAIDGMAVMKKTCKWYGKNFDQSKISMPLDGLDTMCELYAETNAASLSDKTSRKTVAKLNGLCVAMDTGKVTQYDVEYTDVISDLGDFCEDMLNETTSQSRKKVRKVDAVKVFGEVCEWYNPKFEKVSAPGIMADLQPICTDFVDIRDGGGDESLDFLKEDDEFWLLVDLCKGMDKNRVDIRSDNYTDVFDDLADFCAGFMENVKDKLMDNKRKEKFDGVAMLDKICIWLADLSEEKGSIDMLADLEPICKEFDEIYDDDDDNDDDNNNDDDDWLVYEHEFRLLYLLCTTEQYGHIQVNNADYKDVFADLGDFCDGFLDEVEDMKNAEEKKREKKFDAVDVLGEICEWLEDVFEKEGPIDFLADLKPVCSDFFDVHDDDDDDDDDDDGDNFWLIFEHEFRQLYIMCKAEQYGQIQVNNTDYKDVFADLGDFCDGFLNEVDFMKNAEEKRRDDEFDAVDVLEEICEWLKEVFEKKGPIDLLDDLQPVCSDLFDVHDDNDDDDDDDDDNDAYWLIFEHEFRQLYILCKAEQYGRIQVNSYDYKDVFADLGNFCDGFLDEVEYKNNAEEKRLEDKFDAVDVLEEICEWLEDVFEKEGPIDLLADLKPVCSDFVDVQEDDDDDDGEDDWLTDEVEFWLLYSLCEAEQYGKIQVNNTDFKDLFADLGDFCDDFLDEVEDMKKMEEKKRLKEFDVVDVLEKVCEWLEDVFEKEESVDILDGLRPICKDFSDIK